MIEAIGFLLLWAAFYFCLLAIEKIFGLDKPYQDAAGFWHSPMRKCGLNNLPPSPLTSPPVVPPQAPAYVLRGYQPKQSTLDPAKPPQGGSGAQNR